MEFSYDLFPCFYHFIILKETLLNSIAPFFIRIKKSDLGIPAAIEHDPIIVPMGAAQRRIYDVIEKKYMREIVSSRDSQHYSRRTICCNIKNTICSNSATSILYLMCFIQHYHYPIIFQKIYQFIR